MSTTFNFEEFDDATREYLTEVRDREGRGTPGVFAPVSSSAAGCGCIMGPIIIITTLCGTLFSDIIFDDPGGVALLQTAGLLLGGWMLIAAFRIWGSKNSARRAGNWVYGDPLFLYEAAGEQVKVTPVDETIEAQFTHNYNNGAYQNSVVKLLLPGNSIVSVTVNNEQRAENMVVYYNYLAWARGGEGGDRASLEAGTLGGLAKYVAKNDNEPLDGDGNVNLDLIELDVHEVPEEPTREGRAAPNVLPYIVIVVSGLACWFVMKQVNVPFRDDEIYKAVTPPNPVEPRMLRAYLTDSRNTRHRDAAFQLLATFYATPIKHVQDNAKDLKLKAKMIAVLEELKTAEQPVVSIRVKEAAGQGNEEDRKEREKKIRTALADKVSDEFGRAMPPVSPPPGAQFKVPPPPIGHQIIAFVEAPEEATAAHFQIDYKFEPTETPGVVKVRYSVTVRTKLEDDRPVVADFFLPQTYQAGKLDPAATALADQVMRDMIGVAAGVQQPNAGQPVFPPPGFEP